jgi:hypothetical protein
MVESLRFLRVNNLWALAYMPLHPHLHEMVGTMMLTMEADGVAE